MRFYAGAAFLTRLGAVQTVAGLSALTRLGLYPSGQDHSVMPRCEEQACLHSTSLRDLSITIKQVLESPVCE